MAQQHLTVTREKARAWIEAHSEYRFPWPECQTWKYKTTDKGYGRAKYHGREWRAHRLAWTLFYGPIPEGLQVQHRCNNTRCIRPSHLLLGTNVENIAFMVTCGRHSVRNLDGKAVLTPAQSHEIRQRTAHGESLRSLARAFGVSATTIVRHRRKGESHA